MRGEIAILSNRLNNSLCPLLRLLWAIPHQKLGTWTKQRKILAIFFIRIWKFSKKMYFIRKMCLLCSAFLPSSFFLFFFVGNSISCYTNQWNYTKAIFLICQKERLKWKEWSKKICCPQVYLAFCRRPASAEEEGFVPKVGRFNLSPLDRCSFIWQSSLSLSIHL